MVTSYFHPTGQSKICPFGKMKIFVVFYFNPTILAGEGERATELSIFCPIDRSMNLSIVTIAG
ncbi:TPA: hypothetical protein EYO57_36265 [Candidatus Poribacteria bacterium]|nr:hypothetical protein [Candidatus Poribacteria bacterium]